MITKPTILFKLSFFSLKMILLLFLLSMSEIHSIHLQTILGPHLDPWLTCNIAAQVLPWTGQWMHNFQGHREGNGQARGLIPDNSLSLFILHAITFPSAFLTSSKKTFPFLPLAGNLNLQTSP